MPFVTVKKNFQIVIPQEVRDALDIGGGDILLASDVAGDAASRSNRGKTKTKQIIKRYATMKCDYATARAHPA